jgi:flagellar basal-body rod modification protein FlgD
MNPIHNAPPATPFANPEPASSGLDGDGFLTLLMAQLAHQDPTSPVETAQFMQQLTSLNTVQQLLQVNETLEAMMAGITSLNNEGAVNLVGKEVTAMASGFHRDEGEVETIEFDLPADAHRLTIEIIDESGKTVDTLTPTDLKAGPHTIDWAKEAPPGDYTFTVSAKDADGNALAVTTYTTGVVDEIRFDSGFPVLVIDGRHIALSDVITVRPGPSPVVDNQE